MFEVKNFTYNGWYETQLSGIAPYTAKFKEWTNDPGVMEEELERQIAKEL